MRTGKVGLQQFLFQRRVPDIDPPLCSCEEVLETMCHIVTASPLLEDEKAALCAATSSPLLCTSWDLAALLYSNLMNKGEENAGDGCLLEESVAFYP